MNKTVNQKAWFLVLPVLVLVAFSAVIPLMTVVNYSVQDTFGNNVFFWAGLEWFEDMLGSQRMWDALWRQLAFSAIILAIEVPLGIFVALNMPKKGFWASFCLVLMSLPLLVPWNVVGTIWQIFGRVDIGLLGYTLDKIGISYNYTQDFYAAWATVIVMDVWHWTSLVALLAYAGLQSIPDAYYQAAKIDQASRWKVFRFIELPKMAGRSDDRDPAAVHGQFHDLYRTLRGHWGRAGQCDDVPVDRSGQDGAGTVRSWPGRCLLADVLPGDPVDFMGVLHRDDQPRQKGWRVMSDTTVQAPGAAGLPGKVTETKAATRQPRFKVKGSVVVMGLYLLFLLLPIYWLINMSLKTNTEILSSFSLFPRDLTLANYAKILTDPSWYMGYVNSLIYVVMNTVISLAVALPAAYAFSRYTFMGDKHLFFWLLTNRMAPPAVFALPFFQLYSSVGLFDTHIAVALAHCLFNVPLAVWILEGFMRGVPKEIDETAYLDGYSFPRFFIRIFTPLIASGIGVAAFFCFMFSWVELLLSRTLTTVDAKPIAAIMTRTQGAAGVDWGVLAAAGVLTLVPGALVIYFVRNYIAKGFALGRV